MMTMKEKMKGSYLKVNKNFPKLGLLIKRLYKYKRIMNSVTRKVKGKLNLLEYSQAILNNVAFDIKGNGNIVTINYGAVLNNVNFFIRGDNHKIIIQDNCIFSRGGSVWFEHEKGLLVIGKNTTMENVHIAVTEPDSKIEIGEDCMFAYDIDIRTGDSHSIIDSSSGKRINYAKDVVIGNHVWLAAHCRILKGAQINDDSVVGTNSVVTKNFNETGVVLAGCPAEIVKRNITWNRENII
ncbi:MAG: acetyltransferase [SAR324 cluster bacterium]|uniref:Acetyltransferase n=1 Tax=SAR324 cluster bacterium TaxID=2024889 RepID=A0A2A4T3E0_9DELT|nr:MAG: acetyltransferase [SAR324 cluster bacterium]